MTKIDKACTLNFKLLPMRKSYLVSVVYRSQTVQFIVDCNDGKEIDDEYVFSRVCEQQKEIPGRSELSWNKKEIDIFEKIISPLKKYETGSVHKSNELAEFHLRKEMGRQVGAEPV